MPNAEALPIDSSATAMDMANNIFGAGISVQSASYTGDDLSSGIYTNGDSISSELTPADTGVVISTGHVSGITNDAPTSTDTNTTGSRSTNTSGVDGDLDFESIIGPTYNTYDASFLEVTFIPDGDYLTLDFVISSEEYPEFVNSQYLDVVGIWVNGTQATVSIGTGDVSVGNINANTAANLYNDNTGDQFNTEMDGFTVTLSFVAPVTAGEENTIKIGVADVSDSNYDTNLLIAGGSGQSSLVAADDYTNLGLNGTKTLNVLSNDNSTAGTMVVTQINGIDVFPGDSVTLTSGQTVTLADDGTLSNLVVNGDLDSETAYFNYTVENGLGNSDTAIVQIVQMPCFVAGSMIETPSGPVPIETLRAGDLVLTQDDGPQPIKWAGSRETQASGDFAPVKFSAGSFGAQSDVQLSPQHRVLVRTIWAELLFGEPEVLVKAKDLVNGTTVRRVMTGEPITYVHLLFDRHQILECSGLASESYLPGPMMSQNFDADAQAEILALFPELEDISSSGWAAARPILKTHEARALQASASM